MSGRTTSTAPIALAVALGNFLEWFDFAVYGFFAATIGRVFFPSQDPTASLLSSLAVFGVAFIVRPMGGIVIGAIGDRLGRRHALALTVLLMGIATTLVALLPGYATFGVAAPIMLVVLRCVQGLAAGGEWASAASYLLEHTPSEHRALRGSLLTSTAAIGSVAGGALAIGLNTWLTSAQVDSWGWRLPFLLATPLAFAGLYVRLRLDDTPAFQALRMRENMARSPVRESFAGHKKAMTVVFFCAAVHGVCFYYLATYVVNFLTSKPVGMSSRNALIGTVIGLAVYAALCPVAGYVCDKAGRRPTMLVGSAAMAILAIPAFLLLSVGSPLTTVLGMTLLSVFEAAVNVTTLVLMVELFPTRTRMTGGSTAYNVALAALAGPAPLIAAALAAGVHVRGAAAFYMVAVAVAGFAALVAWLPETRGVDLVDDVREEAMGPAAGIGAPRPRNADG
jgi:MHS family proline/betaine transporter-like MFS transporter